MVFFSMLNPAKKVSNKNQLLDVVVRQKVKAPRVIQDNDSQLIDS
jgi:hypothetical protein